MAHDARKVLRHTFDEDAELYDRARPGYPEPLFDDVGALAGLGPDSTVLEIGCGPGKATLPLARRGYSVLCIELGHRLAAVARRNLAAFPRVEVVTAAFETWEPRRAPFDVVFAASSWHWIDPDIRYAKAAALLKPGGALAIVGSGRADGEQSDPFFQQIRECYRTMRAAAEAGSPSHSRPASDPPAEIEQSGLFAQLHVRRYSWATEYTADEYVDFLNTHSGYRAMDPATRAAFYAEVRRLIDTRPGRRVRRPHARTLYLALTPAQHGAA